MKSNNIKTSLVLRTVDHDMTAYGGFKWPDTGEVSAPDWRSDAECGNGLHGILWPAGDWACIKDYEGREKWQVVEVPTETLVEIGGKVKFPAGNVLYTGSMAVALTMISKRWCESVKNGEHMDCAEKTVEGSVSDEEGARLAASGGSSRLAASGGYSQLAASGGSSRLAASGGYSRLAASGYSSQLAASGGYSRLAASGGYSQLAASGGYSRLAASGKKSIAVGAGLNSVASAGEDGCIALSWWDKKAERFRLEVAYVGENGIEPNVMYRLNNEHQFVKAE